MNAGHDPREPHGHVPSAREPLDAEERAWAERLGRIGPSDGPSPALDARILAAAHAAAAGSRRSRHRLGWLALPPALMTGVGVAAAAALALGLVWQLRPRPQIVPADGEGAGGEEIVVMAEPASTRPARTNPPPFVADPEEATARPAPRRELSAGGAKPAGGRTGADANARALPPAAVAPASPPPVPSFHPELGGEPAQRAQASDAAARAVATQAQEAAARQAAEAEGAAARAKTGEPAAATQRQRRMEAQREPPVPATSPEADAAVAETATMDRIEITGSAAASPPAPVDADRQLAPGDWLARIRVRRDAGDLAGAGESLRLFRRAHPNVPIPDDLRALLADAPP